MNNKIFSGFCRNLFAIVFVFGLCLYFYFKTNVWAGFGISSAALSFVSIFHFNKKQTDNKKIETKLTWILLLSSIMGFALIIFNSYQYDSAFVFGLGAGLCLLGAIAYTFELISNFLASVP